MSPATNWLPSRVLIQFFERVAGVEDFVDDRQRVLAHRRTPATITANSLLSQLTLPATSLQLQCEQPVNHYVA